MAKRPIRRPLPTEPIKIEIPESAPKEEKVRYVKRQIQIRQHHCHWPGCDKQVPPAMWGCYRHWMRIPAVLRRRIWACYRPGQETTMTPSRSYVEVAREVQEWIAQNYPNGAAKDR